MKEPQTITLDRKGPVVLIGINRPDAQNRIDPTIFSQLGKAYFEYELDESLRAAVLFGHGDYFFGGLDPQEFVPLLLSGQFSLDAPGTINPLQTSKARLTKPLIVVADGNTFFVGHGLFLAADVRIAAAIAVFSQGDASRALYPVLTR
jgi:enoyl-CoA hydratase/carnithine racemase